LAGASDVGSQAPVPAPAVRKVVLYKHGVGYFERQGEVDGNATLELSFKASQMKDMLKSLFALDLGGGRIANILYDSKDPLSKQLESVLIDVPPDNALTQLAMRLKGAKVEVVVGTRTIQGSVLGIEPVVQRVNDATVTAYKLLLAGDADGVQPVNLFEVSSLKLLDDPLQKDLKRILEAYLKSKYADRKTVLLRAEGNGARPIRIGYIVETPIWKTSYRMLFEEGQTPYLQGWAIAENATDDDWTDVKMTFVAGAPISFSMDLYTSYYPHRQTIGLPTLGATGYAAAALEGDGDEALAFADHGEGEKMLAKEERVRALRADKRRPGIAGEAFAAAPADAPAPAAPPPPMAELAAASMQPMAQGVKVGDLFAYEGKGLVTIPRGKAALVPILGEKLDGTNRILYYKRELSAHPAHACFFKNTTDLTLESGPVTFFDGSTCVGEGVLPKALQSGVHEIVPFALETGCTVEPEVQSRPEDVFRAWLAQGVLYMTHAEVYETVYRCANKMKKDHTLIVEHPKAGGFQLLEPAKPEEDLPGHYRFKLELKAGAKAELKVRERREVTNGVALLQTGPDQIRFYMQQRYLSERAKTFLREVLELQGRIGEAQRELEQAEADRRKAREDLEELRRNVQVLRDTPDELAMRQEMLRKLKAGTDRIEALKQQTESAQSRKRELENQLSRKVQEFTDQ
jgi:hypothetical protein